MVEVHLLAGARTPTWPIYHGFEFFFWVNRIYEYNTEFKEKYSTQPKSY